MNVGVIIPAYNEADRIGRTIKAVQSLAEVKDILVVDDGSRDDTSSESLRAGARVVWHQKNYGKGQALRTGFQSMQNDILVILDADIGEGAVEIRKLIEPVSNGTADMAIAVFPPVGSKNGIGIVKGLAKWGIKRLTGYTVQAPLSGQRVMGKELFQAIHIADGFGVEVAMTIDAIRAGYHVVEVPVVMKNRELGRTIRGFVHRGKQCIHVLRVLMERWNHKPTPIVVKEPPLAVNEDSTPNWR